MTTLRWVLGDQLTPGLSSLVDRDAADPVLLVEAVGEATYVPHHPQKIAMILAAMRHFSADLAERGVPVDHVRLDDPANTGTFEGELLRAVARHRPDRVVVTEPGEWRVRAAMEALRPRLGVPLEIREDDRFLCSHARFRAWAQGRKQLRMEWFYREMRRDTGILMDGAEPVGGQWNFDHDNRRRLPAGVRVPRRVRFAPDAVTQEVIELVRSRFGHHFGDLEAFGWPVSRKQALQALDDFLEVGLPSFGDYQDAMASGEPFLFHSLLAPAMNLGLLLPGEVCAAAERAGREGRAPLNAVEGFVRQILGWREYVRGLYWLRMPEYAATNALGADRPLPAFYWTAETDLACVRSAVADTRKYAYSHHIQRLMVTGNLALLLGVEPAEVEAWYLAVYADAFEWVELPNTHGMALFADGGQMASKPYAASGAYLDRMSDFCRGCAFDPKVKTGPRACPFNLLYWGFLIRNEAALSGNPRMAMPYRTLAGFGEDRRRELAREAEAWRDRLAPIRPAG